MVHLCEVVRTQKTLISLDISWNQLVPKQMKGLMTILQKNRRLTSLNLAWNNIMEAKVEEAQYEANPRWWQDRMKNDINNDPESHEQEVIYKLGKIIKHSRTI